MAKIIKLKPRRRIDPKKAAILYCRQQEIERGWRSGIKKGMTQSDYSKNRKYIEFQVRRARQSNDNLWKPKDNYKIKRQKATRPRIVKSDLSFFRVR